MGVRIFSDRSIQQESDSISRGGFWERGGKKDSGNSVVANNSFEAEATWGDLMPWDLISRYGEHLSNSPSHQRVPR